MQVQLITYRLAGITPADYARRCEQVAVGYAHLPGLLAKVWLGAEVGASGPFGGVYLWRDRAALDAYRASDVYAQLKANPALVEIHDRDFPVLEAPTAVTAALAGVPAGV